MHGLKFMCVRSSGHMKVAHTFNMESLSVLLGPFTVLQARMIASFNVFVNILVNRLHDAGCPFACMLLMLGMHDDGSHNEGV
jgi:hypothetical protein